MFRTGFALLLAVFGCAALAQSPWPAKPVRIVVAYPPGGGIDVMGRQIAERLGAAWSQPVVVENKPGANTIVAADAVAKSPADGYTVLMTTDATFSINPHLYSKLPFDVQRDFMPATMLVLLHQLLVAHPSLPANSLDELIKLAKAKPGVDQLRFLRQRQPAAPCRRDAQAQGRHRPRARAVQGHFARRACRHRRRGAAHLRRHRDLHARRSRRGRIKALAIGGRSRSPLFPQVPTFAELGYPEVETHAWFGFFLPAGTPREAVTRLYQDTRKVLEDPEFRQKQLIDRGYEVVGSGPEEFTAYIRQDSESRRRAVQISGAKAE